MERCNFFSLTLSFSSYIFIVKKKPLTQGRKEKRKLMKYLNLMIIRKLNVLPLQKKKKKKSSHSGVWGIKTDFFFQFFIFYFVQKLYQHERRTRVEIINQNTTTKNLILNLKNALTCVYNRPRFIKIHEIRRFNSHFSPLPLPTQ